MDPVVRIKTHAPGASIILDRPSKRNAISRQLMRELQQAFEDLHLEKRVRAVILTGAGSAFCAGMDLGEMRETAEREDAQQQWYEDTVAYQSLIETMLRFPKPIIAAVNGPAVAGGAGFVLASDIVIAAPEARLGFPEPKRGIVAGMVAPLLCFRAGGGVAANLLLTAEIVDAQRAAEWGLVHEIHPHEKIWARANELAETISQSAPESIQLTKRLLYETLGEDLLTTMLSAGAAASATARTTEAAQEGLNAFLEKRPPQWL